MELELCSGNAFSTWTKEGLQTDLVENGLCLKDKEQATLQGTTLSAISTMMEVRLTRCTGKDSCKNDEELKEYLK